MNTNLYATGIAGDIERQLLAVGCEVWWSPQDRAYVAYSAEFPALIHADARSSLAAINGLEDEIRRTLIKESGRSVDSRS